MTSFTVNREKCTRCKICMDICPRDILTADGEGFPKMSDAPGMRCLECGQCVLFCPSAANSISFTDSDKLVYAKDISLPDDRQAENFLRTRRTIRSFSKKQVPKETLDRIFETVRLSPTAGNRQLVRWIVSYDPEKTRAITNLVLSWCKGNVKKDPESPLGQMGKTMIASAYKGDDKLLRGAPYVAFAVMPKENGWFEDGAIALTYFELAAHAVGVGCCWGGYLTMATRDYAPLREYLGITDEEHLCGAQMFGYPTLRPTRQYPGRKEPNLTIL